MLIYDTLDYLEDYIPIVPGLNKVIDVMDHSTPYDEGPGSYDIPNLENQKYLIEVFLTTKEGKVDNLKGERIVEIVLEGEEIVLIDDNLCVLESGRFILYDEEENTKVVREIVKNFSVATKTVRFLLKK